MNTRAKWGYVTLQIFGILRETGPLAGLNPPMRFEKWQRR
jgi:hypothetical protein